MALARLMTWPIAPILESVTRVPVTVGPSLKLFPDAFLGDLQQFKDALAARSRKLDNLF